MKCSKCARDAVFFQNYSGRHLCPDHLAADIESRIKRDIRAGRWMRPGDHLAVELCGSRSASALLSFIHSLTSRRRDIRLSAVIIDEGIIGYNDHQQAAGFAQNLKIPVFWHSFREEFGMTGDELTRVDDGSPYTRCRQLRHGLIETIAEREGITSILSCRTLDDRAAETLAMILLGNAENLPTVTKGKGRVPWVDPLGSIPEKEVDLYAEILGIPGNRQPCPYSVSDFASEIRTLVEEYTKLHPATLYSIDGIRQSLEGSCRPQKKTQGVQMHAS